MRAIGIRKGWGWLLLATLALSPIGDEISLITLMFRTAGDLTSFAVPMLLIAQLLPGLPFTPNGAIGAYVFGGAPGVIAGLGGWLLFVLSRPE